MSIKNIKTDIVIIGTGTAGMAAYRQAKTYTPNVILLEQAVYGTTCARVGCMPSKLLIAAADAAHESEHSGELGIINQTHIDDKKVMQRVKSERDRFVGFVKQSVDNFDEQDKIMGKGIFIGEREIEVYPNQTTNTQAQPSHHIEFKAAIIATGSRAAYPNFLAQAEDRLLINDDIFEWDNLPKSVALFGPGVIGLELGQALQRLGVEVSLFGVGGVIGPFSDPKLTHYAKDYFASQFRFMDIDSQVTQIKRSDKGVEIDYVHQGQERSLTVDYLIAATGRRPNIDNLGLEVLNLDLDERGVPIAQPSTMQIGDAPIFIAGDASNQLPLLHEAADQGRIAGENAGRLVCNKPLKSGLRHSPIGIVFTQPQLATVGSRYQELMQSCAKNCIAIGEVSFADQGRARVMLKNTGLLRIYAEQGSGLFLGAELAGPAAEHLAHLLVWAHQMRMSIKQMLEMPFYHPVVEEGLRTALRDTLEKLEQGSAIEDKCCDCGVGA